MTRYRNFAVVGVSQDKEKYGHEIFKTLKDAGYRVRPVNPKYVSIEGEECYPTLKALPERPEVVVTAAPPQVTEKVVEACAEMSVPVIWMPPGSWSDSALRKCRDSGLACLHDVCIVFSVRLLAESGKENDQ